MGGYYIQIGENNTDSPLLLLYMITLWKVNLFAAGVRDMVPIWSKFENVTSECQCDALFFCVMSHSQPSLQAASWGM